MNRQLLFDHPGIQLLPLADKRLIAFQTRGEAVFIPTYDAPKELFPGLESCLLADDLDDLLKSKLAKVANEGNCHNNSQYIKHEDIISKKKCGKIEYI